MNPEVLTGEFRAVAVLNRGEAAMRFIRGAETWSRKNRTELETIALYTAADAQTPFVRAATRAVRLDEEATDLKTPYIDIELLLDTAQEAGADAVWPGWGFVAEEPALAKACHERGLIFLGPPEHAISRMSDKVTAKTLAGENDVPVSPWSKEPVDNPELAIEHLETIGYPALLKSAAGGGGRGIRLVEKPDDVHPAFESAAAEAMATSGNPELFIERFVADARHVEVQVLADVHGNVWTLGTRDCSVQRNNQKLLEEAPAPQLDDDVDWTLQHSAHTLATACNYVGVGTAEFLLLPDGESFYFLEMNARLQVEHTVTEAIYGIDLVAFQIDVARGVDLSELPFPEARGVAIEARLNAEDPDDHFAPRTGTLVRFSPPDGPWIRVDTGYAEGNEIPSEFDSNVAKIITWGVNREDAIARMQTALYDTSCGVETGLSNRSLLLEIVKDSPFHTGPVRTRWLASYLPTRRPPAERDHLPVALAAAAIGDHLRARRQELRLFFGEALTGLPRRIQSPGPRALKYMVDGELVDVEMGCLAPMTYVVKSGEWEAVVRARSAGSNAMILDVDGRRHSVIRVLSSDQVHIDVEGVAHRFEKVSDGNVCARIPAAVNQIHVEAGQSVEAGERLITLEAMKMEFPVDAPIAGTIEAVHVGTSESIDAGDVLIEIAPETDDDGDADDSAGIELPAHRRESLEVAEVLRASLLGYDIGEELQERALNALLDEPDSLELGELLQLWSQYLSRECLFWKGPGDDAVNDARESSAEQMAWFLRRRRLDEDALSARFIDRLEHFLSLHGISDIRPGDRLDNALVRLFQARADRSGGDAIATAALQAVLDRTRKLAAEERAELFGAPFAWAGDDARTLLESFATRAADRRRWNLAALTWHYIHALESHAEVLSDDEIPEFDTPPPQASGFDATLLDTDLATAPGVNLRAFFIDANDADDDRRLYVEVAFGPADQVTGDDGPRIPGLERAFLDAATVIRRHSGDRQNRRRWNRIVLRVDGDIQACQKTWSSLARRLAGQTLDLNLEAVVICATGDVITEGVSDPVDCVVLDTATGLGPSVRLLAEPLPLTRLTDHQRGMLGAHRRGRFYPFEVVDWLTGGPGTSRGASRSVAAWPSPPVGSFEEWDFADGEFAPTDRPWGQNEAALVVGTVNNEIGGESRERVLVIGDSTKTMGSLGEEECRRVMAALDLADERGLPLEWVPVSAGARIAFDSGTENLDWTARVLRRIIEFTQDGGIINIVVDGPCVGAQSYWNAEATMLMHCKGTLVMTRRGYMILTGRKALEYSGSISAESNKALGGEEIMVPNGEAQYSARHMLDAYEVLFRHYEFTKAVDAPSTTDPVDRDVTESPGEPGEGYATLAEVFDDEHNPGRKRPFAIRKVMAAVLDSDSAPLERWGGLEGAESAVTWLGKLGGHPVTMIGIESRPVPRKGPHPVDGPDTWMSGTLFPQSSRKIARSINAASGVHPLVVLANLSGFDGSPESLRKRQLEFGAEIARAVVNFEGPILFNVIARYHGGAFVVFSRALHENIRVSALEDTYASVIGGAPAAAVVFPRKVDRRLRDDPRYQRAQSIDDPAEKRSRIASIRADLQSELAAEFDSVHDIERARSVGSLDDIVAAADLRNYLIDLLA